MKCLKVIKENIMKVLTISDTTEHDQKLGKRRVQLVAQAEIGQVQNMTL